MFKNFTMVLKDESGATAIEYGLTLTGDLRRAIESNELELAFQPKVTVRQGTVMGAEVLARWHRKGHGFVSPDEFIVHAEQSGLILPLTKWVLNTALQRGSEWRQVGHDIELAVNLSARLLHHAAIVPMVESMLRKWNYPANRLTLEITENAILIDPNHATEIVTQFAELGVKISIDDFGTGYSSLSYLKNLEVDELKIDKSFVLGLEKNKADRTIVKSVIALAHDLGLRVVAEGIETVNGVTILDEFGCDIGQGHYFSKPIAAIDFEDWLALNKLEIPGVPRSKRGLPSAKVIPLLPHLVPTMAAAHRA